MVSTRSAHRAGRLSSLAPEKTASKLLFILYLVYTVFFFLNVPARIPGLGVLRPTLLLAAFMLVLLFTEGVLFGGKAQSKTSSRLNILLLYMILTLPFVKWPGSVVQSNLPTFIKAVLFFFFTVKILDSVPRLTLFVQVFVSCQIVRVLEPLLLHFSTGYWGSSAHIGSGQFLNRLAGAPYDVVNPNGLAYVAITALAFMHYLMTDTRRTWVTLLYLVLAPGIVYALLLTGSRSGLVGFGVLAAIVFWKSNRKLLLVSIGAIGLAAAVSVMSPDQKDRYLSIFSSDTKNAASAGSRTSGITKDLENWRRYPVFGHGVGTSLEANANYRGQAYYSHVLYTEILVELGVIGAILFLLVLASVVQNSRQAKASLQARASALEKQSPDEYFFMRRLTNAIEAWVGMALVFSLAQYGLSEYNWYLVGGLSVVLHRFARASDEPEPLAS